LLGHIAMHHWLDSCPSCYATCS